MFSWQACLPAGQGRNVPPLIVAHRGASSRAPENTLAAFRRAVDEDADAIELDVRLTGDGEVVVIHDDRLRRTTGARGFVHATHFRDLRRLSAGRWFHRTFAGERIPTLDEVYDLVRGRIGLNIELKVSARRGRRKEGELLASRCLDIIRRHHGEEMTLLSSFHRPTMLWLKKKSPAIKTGLLFHPLTRVGRDPASVARKSGVEFAILSGSMMRKRTVGALQEKGIGVGVFTVDSLRGFERSRKMGLDFVITNEPAAMIRFRSRNL